MLFLKNIAGALLSYLSLDNVLRVVHSYLARVANILLNWASFKFFHFYVFLKHGSNYFWRDKMVLNWVKMSRRKYISEQKKVKELLRFDSNIVYRKRWNPKQRILVAASFYFISKLGTFFRTTSCSISDPPALPKLFQTSKSPTHISSMTFKQWLIIWSLMFWLQLFSVLCKQSWKFSGIFVSRFLFSIFYLVF